MWEEHERRRWEVLDWVDAPVLVAEPGGRIVHANSRLRSMTAADHVTEVLPELPWPPTDSGSVDAVGVRRMGEYWVLTLCDAPDRLRRELEYLRTRNLVLESASLGTWDWHIPSGRVDYDSNWAAMFGYDVKDLAPDLRTWLELVHPDDLEGANAALDEHLAGRCDTYVSEHRCRHADGRDVWVLDMGRVVQWDDDGLPVRATGIHMDITQRKRAEAERERLIAELEQTKADLSELARQDELTGLGNRRVLQEAMDNAWLAGFGRGEPMALVVVDLDALKAFNDQHGHARADQELRAAALAMQSVVRSKDTVSRFGGDEFVVVLPGVDPSAAMQAAHRIRACIATCTGLTASVGVACWTPGCGIQDQDQWFMAADAAVYDAKAAGGDVVRSCDGANTYGRTQA